MEQLTLGERALLLICCTDHSVAACRNCGCAVFLTHVYAYLSQSPYCSCPRCGDDLTADVRVHARTCPIIKGRPAA